MTLKSDQVEPPPSLSFSAYRWLFGILREAFWGPTGLFLKGKIIHSERSGWHTQRKNKRLNKKKTKNHILWIWSLNDLQPRASLRRCYERKRQRGKCWGERWVFSALLWALPPPFCSKNLAVIPHRQPTENLFSYFFLSFFFALSLPQKPRSPAPPKINRLGARLWLHAPGGCGRFSTRCGGGSVCVGGG